MDSTWLPGLPYLVQIQKAELWLLQQPPPSNPVTDVLGKQTAGPIGNIPIHY